VRELLLPLWSSYYFFTIYANACGYEATRRTDSTNELDRYILAKLRETVESVTEHLDDLDSPFAAAALRDFADVLTNWYVRRSRDRFWVGVTEDGENADAFDTLFTVLETLCRLAAPLLPLVTEHIWQGLTGGRSVHLEDWPDAAELPADHELVAAMDAVRQIASTGLSLRKANGLRVRLPLAQLTVVVPDASRLSAFDGILRDELNVKAVAFVAETETSADDYGITRRLSVNARAAGPRLGKQVQDAIKAARGGDWSESDGVVTAGGIALEPGEYELVLEVAQKGDGSEALALLPGGGFVLLDTHVTPELAAEGAARDLIRNVQDARKAAGLDVSDRIRLQLTLDEASAAAARTHAELIAAETLAVDFDVAVGEPSIDVQKVEVSA